MPVITWLHETSDNQTFTLDGLHLVSLRSDSVRQSIQKTYRLSSSGVKLELANLTREDEGVYRCVAGNSLGQVDYNYRAF